jgi:hypothetical protein
MFVQCLESERVSYKQRVENTVQLDIPLEAAINKEEVERYRVSLKSVWYTLYSK